MRPMAIPGWWVGVLLLALTLMLLGGCGRSDQNAAQVSPLPLAPTAPPTTSATAEVPSSPTRTQPTPVDTQLIPSITVAYIESAVAADRQTPAARATAAAAWAQTPAPTNLPPSNRAYLRDQWPATTQQADPTTRLFLRNLGRDSRQPDTFWEVQLPDGQLRRLPAVETHGIDKSAQVSPDGRFLAYVTGEAKTQERTLRVLNLDQGIDAGIAVPVDAGSPRCLQPFAWSPDGHTLAAVVGNFTPSGHSAQLRLYHFEPNPAPPQTLLERPYFLDLIGWLDAEHVLLSYWKPSVRPAQLLLVDRQGQAVVTKETRPERLECASLSPDGQTLLYNEQSRIKRLRLATGEEEVFPWWPNQFFWVGQGRTLLISPFNTARQVWLSPFDQPLVSFNDQPGTFLSPPYQAGYKFGIIGVSPDEQTLVACEQPPRDDPRIRTSESRTWLYSIPNDRWTPLDLRQDFSCAVVAGWSSAGGAQ